MATFLRRALTGKAAKASDVDDASDEMGDLDLDADNGEAEAALMADLQGSRSRSLSSTERKELTKTDYPFTAEQTELLGKLREMLATEIASAPQFPELVSDRRLMRFLRGHKFDLQVAATMYRNMLAWRREYGADAIRQDIIDRKLEPPQFPAHGRIMRYYPSHIHHGEDDKGRPVHIELIGNVQPRKVMSCFSEEEWVRHHVYCMEYNALMLDKLTMERGMLMRIVLIYDLRGVGPGHLRSRNGWEIIRKTLAITQDFYPESMHKTYLLNAPKIFSVAWSLLKPCLAERTVAKIEMIGSKYKKLQETIPLQSLPVSLGGSRPDEWPLVFDKKEYDEIDREYKVLEVGKGSKTAVTVPVESGTFIIWGYYLKSGDINLAVRLSGPIASEHEEAKDAEGESGGVVVQTVERLDSTGGSFEASSSGVLHLDFDNSFSWMTKKTVHYYVYAVPQKFKHHLDSPRRGKITAFFEDGGVAN